MRKSIKIFLLALALGIIMPAVSHAQNSPFKLLNGIISPVLNSYTLRLPYLGGGGILCLQTDNDGDVSVATGPCGSGSGGGGSGGTFSTTTAWGSILYNYPNNATDIVAIGYSGSGIATSSNAEFYVDPTAKIAGFLNTTKVGIGTTTPATPLHVLGVGTEGTIISQTDLTTSYAGLLVRDYQGLNAFSLQYGNRLANPFPDEVFIASRQSTIPYGFFQGGIAAANRRFSIASSTSPNVERSGVYVSNANFGIGTTSPYTNLSVQGNGFFSGDVAIAKLTATGTITSSGTGTSTFTGGISSAGLASSNGLTVTGEIVANLATNQIARLNNGASGSGIWGTNIGLLSQSSEGQIVIRSGVNAITFKSAGTLNSMSSGNEIAKITSTGLFGIGTTTPGKLLSVNNDAVITGNLNVAGIFATSTINNSSTATSTFSGGIATAGLSSSAGLILSGGSILSSSSATSTLANGFNLTSGCFAINGTCISGSGGGSGDITSVGDVASGAAFDGTQGTTLTFNNAGGDGTIGYDGTQFSISHPIAITGGTSTFSGGVGTAGLSTSAGLTITGGTILSTSAGTSTLANGFNITSGCFAVRGTCISAGSGGSATPAGSDTQVQYNDGGSFGGASGIVYNDTLFVTGLGTSTPSKRLSVQDDALISGNLTVAGIIATSTINTTSVATSTWLGGHSVVGLSSSAGILNTAGSINSTSVATSSWSGGHSLTSISLSNGLTVSGGSILNTSSATSTFSGGISVGSIGGLSSAAGLTISGGKLFITSTATSTSQSPILTKNRKILPIVINGDDANGDFDNTTRVAPHYIPHNIQIVSIHAVQTGATNVIGGVYYCTAAGSCTAVDSDITITTGEATDDGSLSNPNVSAGNYVGWRTTSVSGTNTSVNITVMYQDAF